MRNIAFTLNQLGLANALIYRFDESGEPLDVKTVELPKQERKGNGSIRLDTGSADAQVYNWLGLPVFCSATLIDPEDDTNAVDLLTVIFEVSMSKNIDTVAVNGVDGTIKTYISDGDFDVKIKAILTTDNADDYPLDAVEKLVELLKIKKSLKVVCDYLLIFGIYELTITDFSMPQAEGIQNIQLFNISALSDKPIELLEAI
jgi:Domain of unknown function (DUF6046)